MPPGWVTMAALLLPLLLPCSAATSHLVEGHIAVPGTHIGRDTQDSFLTDVAKLWPNGVVFYRFEMSDLDGITENLFRDEQVENITTALDHIMQEVPCIKFSPVRPDYSGAHLIYTTTGDSNNGPNRCYSYLGRVGGQGGRRGQVVNLGDPLCLYIGVILHDTLHALGIGKISIADIFKTELSVTERIELGRAYSDPADPDRCFTTSNLRLYAEEADRRSGQLLQAGRGAVAVALALANRQGSSCELAGVVMQRRVRGAAADYFDKSFEEYRRGFSDGGEMWLGLDKLAALTAVDNWSLRVTMTDWDLKQYVAIYDHFKVTQDDAQDFVLSISGYNSSQSSLGDSLSALCCTNNGGLFSTRDRDRDTWMGSCHRGNGEAWRPGQGGWWSWDYEEGGSGCSNWANPNGHNSAGPHKGGRYADSGKGMILWYHGGPRGESFDNWASSEFILTPNNPDFLSLTHITT